MNEEWYNDQIRNQAEPDWVNFYIQYRFLIFIYVLLRGQTTRHG